MSALHYAGLSQAKHIGDAKSKHGIQGFKGLAFSKGHGGPHTVDFAVLNPRRNELIPQILCGAITSVFWSRLACQLATGVKGLRAGRGTGRGQMGLENSGLKKGNR